MDLLADTWVLWLSSTIVLLGWLVYRKQHIQDFSSMYTSADDFSIRNILFSFKKGEADIFFSYILSIIFFSLFIAGFVRMVQNVY